MSRWIAILFAAPVLFAQDAMPREAPKTLIIPEQLRFSANDFRKGPAISSLPSIVKFKVRPTGECSIPLLRMPAGPESAGPMRTVPVEPVEGMPNRVPAPPCAER